MEVIDKLLTYYFLVGSDDRPRMDDSSLTEICDAITLLEPYEAKLQINVNA